jgi:hypothetical protein
LPPTNDQQQNTPPNKNKLTLEARNEERHFACDATAPPYTCSTPWFVLLVVVVVAVVAVVVWLLGGGWFLPLY